MAIPRKFGNQLQALCDSAVALADLHHADAILLLAERPLDWVRLQETCGVRTLIVAADTEDQLAGAHEDDPSLDFDTILLGMDGAPVYERLTGALLEAVEEELVKSTASMVVLYSSFDPGVIDSVSLIRLEEHLGRLTVRDLRQFEGKVPTETLKLVVDLCVDIGREGREGTPVGTLMVVGDHRKTLEFCKPMGFDPVKGYTAAERTLSDAKVREGVKEIAQLDGAFVISSGGVVMAAAQHLSAPAAQDISLSKGLGARHWAAAQISRATGAIAVAVSASSGTVRVFQDGEVVLRVEPLRRAMTWREFEADGERVARPRGLKERPNRPRGAADEPPAEKPAESPTAGASEPPAAADPG
ncbi:MAG: DNA integrity scanning protein DisA nucleotide-binding domain protein [Lacipirellulaceae bacterium]